MNWKDLSEKVNEAIEKKDVQPEKVHVDFIYVTTSAKKIRASIRKSKKKNSDTTHTLFVDYSSVR